MCKYYCERLCQDLYPYISKDVISIIIQYIHSHNTKVLKQLIQKTRGIKSVLDIYSFPTKNVIFIDPDSEEFKEYQENLDDNNEGEIFSGNINPRGTVVFCYKHKTRGGYIKGWNIYPNSGNDLDFYGDNLETSKDISNFEYEISMERRWSHQRNYKL